MVMQNPPMENWLGALKLDCPAQKHALHAALDTIEKACGTWKIDKTLVSRARIVVEELFSNTIKYGYGGECERQVRLRLTPHPELTLTYEDDAAPFNPLIWKAQPDEALPLGERPIGQAGIAMVIGLAANVSYQRIGGANCLTVIFAQKS
jgi:serine/threonine-protein kinase RsbW